MRKRQTSVLAIAVCFCLMGCVHHLRKSPYAEPPVSSYHITHLSLTAPGAPERIQAATVTPDFFSTTRVQPMLGRAFVPAEHQTVLLNHRFWQRKFAGNPATLGMRLELDKQSFTIIGVLPADFDFPPGTELWLPTNGGNNK